MNIFVTHMDLDGLGSVIVNEVLNIDDFDEIFSVNYGTDEEDELYDFVKRLTGPFKITYADFSPNPNMRDLLDTKNCKVLVFDHHEAVFDELNQWGNGKDNIELHLTTEKCGTKIYYDYIDTKHSNTVLNSFVNLVDIYDRFVKTSENWDMASKLNRLMYQLIDFKSGFTAPTLIKHRPFIDSIVMKCIKFPRFGFSPFEEKKIESAIAKEKAMIRDFETGKRFLKKRIDEKGDYFIVLESPSKISAIADYFLSKYKHIKYVLAVNSFNKDELKISARSREDEFSVLNLEGIQGHTGAGGYADVTNEICESLLNGSLYSLKRLD